MKFFSFTLILFVLVFTLPILSATPHKIKVTAQRPEIKFIFDNLQYPVNIKHLGASDGTIVTSEVSGEVTHINKRYGDNVSKNEIVTSIKSRNNFDTKTYYSRSPLKGKINKVYISNGSSIEKAEKLYSIIDRDQIEVSIEAIASNINKIKLNLKGELYLIDLNKKIPIYVDRKVSVINPKSGTFKVVLKVKKEDEQYLILGLEGTVTFQVNKHQRILIEEKSLYNNGDSFLLPIINDNKIKLVPVELGQKRNDKVEIISGISEQDTYVVNSKSYLENNDLVEIESK